MAERRTTTRKPAPATKSRARTKPEPAKPRRQAAAKPKAATKAQRRPPSTPSRSSAATGPAVSPDALPASSREPWGDRLALILEGVPADATVADVVRLLDEAVRLGGDPLRRDVYLSRGVSRDGAEFEYAVAARRDCLLAFAQRQRRYAGHDEGAIFENDTFEKGTPNGQGETLAERAGIAHTSGAPGKRGRLVGAWCAVEMRGEPPTVRVLDAVDYVGEEGEREQLDPEDPKRRHPDLCLIAAAMSNALRIACRLNDVVGAEELDRVPRATAPAEASAPPELADSTDELDQQIVALYREARQLDPTLWPPAELRARLLGAPSREDREALRHEMAESLAPLRERQEREADARRPSPAKLRARLDELRAFDVSDLDPEDREAHETEVRLLERRLAEAGEDVGAGS